MELSCIFVGSRGLLDSCTRKSPNPISDFDGLNVSLYENSKANEIIHVCPQALPNFVRKVLPTLINPFILVTNNSDLTTPDDIADEYDILLQSPLLKHWFAQNCVLTHEKITRIPIGLDYHSLRPSKKQFAWSPPEKHPWGLKANPILQEQELLNLKALSVSIEQREVKAYANFQFLMSTRYGKIDRVECFNKVPKDLVFYEPTRAIRSVCWTNMTKYAFVLSPQGNGLDCHRTWEALCLGCIPILKSSGLDPLFENLPVWIIGDWSEVTYEAMKAKIDEFKNKSFALEKLTLKYWQNLFASKQDAAS